MKVRRGLLGGQYKPLSDNDIEQIHQTILKVFAKIGVQVNFPEARKLFKKAGAAVDESSRVVKIPPDLVEDLIAQAPSVVKLCGRDASGDLDCEIGGHRVYLGTGGTALNVQDPGDNGCRRSQLTDVMHMARLVEALDNIHFYMLNVYPNDLPVEEVDVNRFGAALNHTRKHVMGGVYTVAGVRDVIKMAGIIAGSHTKLQERPFISMVTCPISPFKLDESYGQLTMEIARQGIPVVVPTEPLCGATAPITLAGNLVVQSVDTLAGVMLTQLVNPGTPVLYGCISSITDLRDMKYLSGAIEMGLMNAAAAQMARFYKLPLYSTAGMSDAKVNDAQAGYESALTSLMVALAGGNLIHDAAGFLEFCMTASYDKLAVDNEIIGMVMRAVEGIRVDDETLAFDLLKKVGPGGHFVSTRHTRRHMRNEQYHPRLSNRDSREQWQAAGAKTTQARATEKVREILDQPVQSVLPPEIKEQIRKETPGLRAEIMA
ncbi:MAG: trimethylamine methyltransferase family protein [Deltaproteobacteria bacterium]|nr:trimethylamine methyltransferase family protein [Deltaproteobacteria bacterium]MBW1952682.1 trimethylamine methyltransferase family protein [Deltaproteobacteria bacterium]MBW1985786.1 trimethylamine methyltransferase family protein [Deltaproteobacteria bacterium]MBW2133896.1 trimethylamine methyltransferase family protein [Deltaproteobacteria bacterium]